MAQYRLDEMVQRAKEHAADNNPQAAVTILGALCESLVKLGGFQHMEYDSETGRVTSPYGYNTKR